MVLAPAPPETKRLISTNRRPPAEFLAELDVSERGGQVDLVAQVVQHVHDRHAGARIGRVGRKLVARDAAHVQVGQAAFERVADLDARFLDRRVQEDEQAAGRGGLSDLTLTENPFGLDFDRSSRIRSA